MVFTLTCLASVEGSLAEGGYIAIPPSSVGGGHTARAQQAALCRLFYAYVFAAVITPEHPQKYSQTSKQVYRVRLTDRMLCSRVRV